MKRKRYKKKYKDRVIDYAKKSGKSTAEVAREKGLPYPTLYGWMNPKEKNKITKKSQHISEFTITTVTIKLKYE